MAVSTYNAIGSVTLSSAQSSFTFSNIPQIYTDLVLVSSVKYTSSPGIDLVIRFNGDAGGTDNTNGNYATAVLWTDGTSAGGARLVNRTSIYTDYYGAPDTTSNNLNTVNIMNYSNSTTHKSAIMRANSSIGVDTSVGLWRSTAPITSVTLLPAGGAITFTAGSTFNLYGVGANQLKASGGDIIVSDGTYWYHAFKASGVFTPNSSLSCSVLVVAGGGAGGGYCGGGGAGGVAYQASRTISSASAVTVGAGGSRQATVNQSANGASGSNSVFDTITANGGGGGGSISNNGTAGGSGGGGANATSGGAATQGSSGGATGYGFAGGTGLNAPTLGGGGGGAGAVGANAVVGTNAGNGGIGLDTWSAWLTATNLGISGYIAGGGGGGSDNGTLVGRGGFGGGTAGSSGGTVAANAMVNTGGGGGGSQNPGGVINSGAGGSGLVIVRYAV